MPVLTAPPPTSIRSLPPRPRPVVSFRPPPAMELPTVSFFGRTLAEYAQFFALDIDALRGRDVLDVAAGPSSFTAEACARRIDAVAVDPFYSSPMDDLSSRIDADYTRMFAQIRTKPRLFRLRTFPSLEAAEADRRLAAQRFLADYDAHFAHGRYVGGALPRLPFFDRTFDLVLCAHLLFIYAARFDFDWHLAACRELVRVSDGEVRIHPLCGPDGKPYAKLPALRRELRAGGIETEVVGVDYEFFVGANTMLVLRRAAT
ncbi:MAG TPA: methyltransferase [Opitutaceae bacterium]|nr:methyltransferase [Opitutaceae bacterium]